jgi:hypothetical protein
LQWRVALLNRLRRCLLVERDLALLLEVLLANLLRRRRKLGDVRVVALLDVLVHALEDGLLLDALHLFFLDDAAEPVVLGLAVAEVDASGHGQLIPDRFFCLVSVVAGQVGLALSRHDE